MLRRTLFIIAGLVAVLLPAAATSTIAGAQTTNTYTVTFENLTEAQYFTPPNFAIHSDDVDVFDLRSPASPGVQAVAENGAVPILAAELQGAIDAAGEGVSGVGAAAPIPAGESATFEVTSNERKFSLVSMIICTNDGFTGADAKNLPGEGQTITYDLRGYDAGTEVNTERLRDIVPVPFCGSVGVGTGETNPSLAENGVIRVHRTLQGNGDLAPNLDWDNNEAIARVTITNGGDPAPAPTPDPAPAPTPDPAPAPTPDPAPAPNGDTPSYTVTFENLTEAQYFTPPNFAIHSDDVDVFDLRSPASPGVQAVAENGAVPILAAELQGAIDAAGEGVSGVGAAAPIPAGESATFEVTSNERKFSLVSMIICTNDGFTGADAKNLPGEGQTITYDLRGYDAGTEVNTERLRDIVPVPFCGSVGVGTGETNPSLAENGVIRVHRTLQGNGDLAPNLDWDNNEAIARVTITRTN